MPILILREGRDNLDIRMSLFCSSASLTNSFSPKGSSISIQYFFAKLRCSRNSTKKWFLEGFSWSSC